MNTILILLSLISNHMAHNPRPDACRTYNWGGYDPTDGITCETVNIPVIQETTVKHDVTVTPSPVVTAVQDTPKTCHNKNSGKDGTSAECNAGIGQEKHDK